MILSYNDWWNFSPAPLREVFVKIILQDDTQSDPTELAPLGSAREESLAHLPLPPLPMETQIKPAPKAGADAKALADMILGVQRHFLVDLAKELSQAQVSFVQFFLLGHLDQDKALTMSEIARRMGHSTAAATGLVDRLEKLGFVQRTHSKDDRRKVLVQITRKGSRLVDTIRQSITQSVESLMLNLGEDEQQTWMTVYQKVFSYCNRV